MTRRQRYNLAVMKLAWMLALTLAARLPAQDVFGSTIWPVIERDCLGCHNTKLKMSNLSLASGAEALAGGKRGSTIVPGDAAKSRLIEALRQTGSLRMPPGRVLPEVEIAAFERWIREGAKWPESQVAKSAPKPNHWSFLAPKRPAEPAVKNAAWPRNAIDRFILARLEKEGIAPSAQASRHTLARRLYLDLTGLPPTPGQLREFLADQRHDAYPRLVEKLLASPHFGERWGRLWLDQARYADSDGGSRDEPRQLWKYRDWVIDALNRDQPFDRFVVEQLAGDMLPDATPAQLTATGFHRNSPIQIEAGTDREQYRVEAVVDRVDLTGTVFLGLSAGCARCHDHKYDPISNREYYQLLAIFNSTDDWSEARPRYDARLHNLHDVQGPLLRFGTPEQLKQWDETYQRMLSLQKGKENEKEFARLKASLPQFPTTMIMRELPEPRETYIMQGGDYLRKGDRVEPAVPAFLHAATGKMDRLAFAKWLVDPANPLLARVTVNRIWQQYFGRGIVETENDFGTQGTPPTHPELLDWLATEFVRSGWSQKAIHRLIAGSAVYRQASEVRRDLDERDPRNLLLARQTRLRLDAELVRDASLVASGLLTETIGGPSVFPPQPDGAMSASQIRKEWTESKGPDRYRRGMYTFFWRVTPHPALIVFDSPNSMVGCTRRNRSNTPLQALTLLNDAAFFEMAEALARRLEREEPADAAKRLERAFEICLSRPPKPYEVDKLRELLAAEPDTGWNSAARVLLNLDEFITRE
ncbi:MAG: PSD1 and planctomycete cytochrome C domain-containing protein [Bryobacteraceae bacterium]|nr:PSD1 and planctomycete cytochrome C domain-containing protein [Bryobacteraceae bacterium]